MKQRYQKLCSATLRRKISEGFRTFGALNSRLTIPGENTEKTYKLGFLLFAVASGKP